MNRGEPECNDGGDTVVSAVGRCVFADGVVMRNVAAHEPLRRTMAGTRNLSGREAPPAICM
jgi:hypothetical protein